METGTEGDLTMVGGGGRAGMAGSVGVTAVVMMVGTDDLWVVS